MSRTRIVLSLALLLGVGLGLALLPGVSQAGRIGGPLVLEGSAAPNDYDVFTARFEGGKQARVIVQNAGRADLDVKIIDPQTLRVVAQDLRTASDARVAFVPPRTKEYIILIHNFSRNMSARYVLVTN